MRYPIPSVVAATAFWTAAAEHSRKISKRLFSIKSKQGHSLDLAPGSGCLWSSRADRQGGIREHLSKAANRASNDGSVANIIAPERDSTQ
ncbi:MAG TPA: hypothetical protein PKY10_13865 [Lentisphaeria bacterium]|nr:hypothetical protein [Lentisphaeria bacterium]